MSVCDSAGVVDEHWVLFSEYPKLIVKLHVVEMGVYVICTVSKY